MNKSRRAWQSGRIALAAVAVIALASIGGCYYPGGPRYSADRHTFESHSWQPWTVKLTDTRTGEVVWSVDVPVGQQLVVGFKPGSGPNEYKPDEIVWGIMEKGKRFGTRDNRQPCPPREARKLEATLRPTPELITPVTDEAAAAGIWDRQSTGDDARAWD